MPALHINTSRRPYDFARKVSAAALTEVSEARSHGMKDTVVEELVCANEMTSSALAAFLPVKVMCLGWCLARARTDSLPRPPVPKIVLQMSCNLTHFCGALLTSSDQYDLASQIWDIRSWVECGDLHD